MPFEYFVGTVAAVITVSGTWATAWYRFRSKKLEVADVGAARQEERDEKDFRHRMDYYHQVLMESDRLFNSYMPVASTPFAAVGHTPPPPANKAKFDELIAGIEVFGLQPVKEAADILMRAHDLRSQPKVVAARADFVDAVRLDVAPPYDRPAVQLEARPRHISRHAA